MDSLKVRHAQHSPASFSVNKWITQESATRIILNPQYAEYLALVKAARNGAVYGAKVRFPHALVMVFLFRSGTYVPLSPSLSPPVPRQSPPNTQKRTTHHSARPHSLREKLHLIIKATRQHARNLATFAVLYKTTLFALRHLPSLSLSPSATSSTSNPPNKEGRYDTFLAGLLGGYAVFGRGRGAQSSVNQQIVIYVFARVVLALAKMSVQPGGVLGQTLALSSTTDSGDGTVKARRGTVERNAWPVFASLSWAFVMFIFRWYPEMLQPSLRSSMKYIYVNADHWDGLRNFLWHNK
ncbi:hypothetical protein MMC16_002570 [Acarospora aff. strigata]|nr:hypothetical protein [Acarospora aff. strigata]